MFTVALLTAFATSVHNGALKPPAVFSATFGTPWTLAGVVGHAIEAYVEMLENMFLVYDVGCFGLNHGIHRIFFYTDRRPITAICGWFALITRVAAIPSRAGMLMSVRTTVGLSFPTAKTAASPFDASPAM